MTTRSHRAYAATQRETSVSSAKPVELVAMVYQRLLDHLHTGKIQMAEGSDSSESLTKAIDLSYVGPSPVVNAHVRANGKEVHVLSGAMRGGEALVVRGEGILTTEDLRGKTIATPQLGNTQDVECRFWLLEHGMKVTLVGGAARVIPTANPDMLQLFTQGKLDGAWTVEPWITRLVNEAGGRIFHCDPNAVTTVLAARSAGEAEYARRGPGTDRVTDAWRWRPGTG